MNPVDTALKLYLDNMTRDFKHINDVSRKAVLVNIGSYAAGIIRTVNFELGRKNGSLNIDALQGNEPENSRSFDTQNNREREIIHAQKPEITTLNGFFCELQSCGKSMEGMRKGTRFCSKKCNNLSRNN